MDIKSFEPLIGSLLRAGSPAIATGVTLAASAIPGVGLFSGLIGQGVGTLLPLIATALGAPPESTPDQLSATIDANPSSAQNKLASLEEQHASSLAMLKQRDDTAIAMQAQQIAVDTVEAQSPSLFIGGARPALMWSLGAVLMLSVTLPYVIWIVANFGGHILPPPELPQQVTYLLYGLLGITVAARSVDKATGTATVHIASRKK